MMYDDHKLLMQPPALARRDYVQFRPVQGREVCLYPLDREYVCDEPAECAFRWCFSYGWLHHHIGPWRPRCNAHTAPGDP